MEKNNIKDLIFQKKKAILELDFPDLINHKILSFSSFSMTSIDIGVINLGLVTSTISLNGSIVIDEIKLVNIQDFECLPDCELYHDKCFGDYMEHVFRKYNKFFESDVILVERQPIQGFTVIEQLIFSRYRNKSYLISPNSMHCFFQINELDYENRKLYTIKIAERYLENFQYFQDLERKHDIADAVCFILFYVSFNETMYLEYKLLWERKKIKKKFIDENKNFFCFINSFKYK